MKLPLFSTRVTKQLCLLLLALHSTHLIALVQGITFTETDISENSPVGATVGFFDFIYQDRNESYSFQLLKVTPSWAENSFKLESNGSLYTARSLDYESSSKYSITLKGDSSGGKSLVQSFDIEVSDIPEIINLILSKDRFPENEQNSSVGSLIGITDDNNQSTQFTFLILNDDKNFSIREGQLFAVNGFDYEQTPKKELQIQVSAPGYQSLDKNFTIYIEDQYENHAPSDLRFFSAGIDENLTAGQLAGTLHGKDPDAFDMLSYSLIDQGQAPDLNVTKDGKVLTNRIFDFEANNTFLFSARVTDGSGEKFDGNFTLEILDDPSDNASSKEPKGVIKGRVYDDENENASGIDHFEILAFDVNQSMAEELPVKTKLRIEENGNYSIKIDPGWYSLKITGAYSNEPYTVFSPSDYPEGVVKVSDKTLELTNVNWPLSPILLTTDTFDVNSSINSMVAGRVTDTNGSPLAGIAIEMREQGQKLKALPIRVGLTGVDGNFSMDLEPGVYQFFARDYSGVWMQKPNEHKRKIISKQTPIENLDFSLVQRPQIKVSGMLMNDQAFPALGTIKFWDQSRNHTQLISPVGFHNLSTGEFEYTLPRGEYLVQATDPRGIYMESWYGGRSRFTAKTVGDSNKSEFENIDLVMDKNSEINFYITYKNGNIPVERPPILEVFYNDPGKLFAEDLFYPAAEKTSTDGEFLYRLKDVPMHLSLLPVFESKSANTFQEADPNNQRLFFRKDDNSWSAKLNRINFYTIDNNKSILNLDEFPEFTKGSIHGQTEAYSLEVKTSTANYRSISGIVSSPNGLVVSNAQVLAKNLETGYTIVSHSDGCGQFRLEGLRDGQWDFSCYPPDGVHYKYFTDVSKQVSVGFDEKNVSLVLNQANVIGQAAFVNALGDHQKARSGWCFAVPTENLMDSNPSLSSEAGYYSELDESGYFAMQLPQGNYNFTVQVDSYSGQSKRQTFSFRIVDPEQVLVIGDRFEFSWPKVPNTLEYLLQQETHFSGHYENLVRFEGNQTTGIFHGEPISKYHQKYRIFAKTKYTFNTLSSVEKYLDSKNIHEIGQIEAMGDLNESLTYLNGEHPYIPFYELDSYELQALTGDSSLPEGNYTILKQLGEANQTAEIFIAPVEVRQNVSSQIGGNKELEYDVSSSEKWISTDTSYHRDIVFHEPDLRIKFPIIEFQITDFEIMGMIEDKNKSPLSGFEIIASNSNGSVLKTKSDSIGNYSFSVGEGIWEVVVGKTNFTQEKRKIAQVSSSKPESRVDFMLNRFASSALIKGQISGVDDLAGYGAEVRLSGENGVFDAKVEDNGSFTLSVPEGFYEIYPWIDSRSGFYPEFEQPEFPQANVFDSYAMDSPYSSITISSDSNQSVEISVDNLVARIQGYVRDSNGISIPGVVVTALSDLEELLITETDFSGFFKFEVRPQAQWTIQCDFMGSITQNARRYEAPEFKRFWISSSEEEKNIEFIVEELRGEIKGSLPGGEDYFGSHAYLMKTDLWGNETLMSKAMIDPRGAFSLPVPEAEELLGIYDASLTFGVIADWTGSLPAVNPTTTPVDYLSEELYEDSISLKAKKQVTVSGRFTRNGIEKNLGWSGEVFAISLKDITASKQESDMRVERISEDGSFSFFVPERGNWSFDYRLYEVPVEDKGFQPSMSSSLSLRVNTESIDLDDYGFGNIKYLNSDDLLPFRINLLTPSKQRVLGLCNLELVMHSSDVQNRGFPRSRYSFATTDGSIEGEVLAKGMYDLWVFPGPELRELGYFMPKAKTLWIDSNSLEHNLTIPSRLKSPSNLTDISFSINQQPKGGTANIHPIEGNWTYEPKLNFYGSDSFIVKVTEDLSSPVFTTIELTVPKEGDPTNISGNLLNTTTLEGIVLGLDGKPIRLPGGGDQRKRPVIWITSSTGLFSWWYAEADGTFRFVDVPPNLEWYVGGMYYDPLLGKDMATFNDIGPHTSGDTEIELELMDFSGATPMPDVKSEFFDPWSDYRLLLEDGMEILIPKGAIPVDPSQRKIRVVVSPSLDTLHRDLFCVPVGYGYEISLFDEKGRLIDGQFTKKVKLRIPLNSFFLDGMDLNASDVQVAYFDHSYNSWRPEPNQVLDSNLSIHLLVDHFSTWVPIAYAGVDATLPVAMGESVKVIEGTSWYEHDWFGKFFAAPNSNWIYHSVHGWLFTEDANDKMVWIWDPILEDWLWTCSENYDDGRKHFFFSNKWKSYLWHSPETTNPRWLFDYERNAWFLVKSSGFGKNTGQTNPNLEFSVSIDNQNPTYGEVSGGGMYVSGLLPSLSAKPNYGYIFDGWSVKHEKSSNQEKIKLHEFTFVSPLNRSVNVAAQFSKISPMSVEVEYIGNGKGAVQGLKNEYNFGESVLLQAEVQAADQSIFMGWLDENGSISWDDQFIIEKLETKRSLKAVFELATIENILRKRYAQ